MNLEMLQAIIDDAGGEENIYAFIFDNVSRKVFDKTPLNLAELLVPNTEILKFEDFDPSHNAYTVYKPVEYIQTVITVKDIALKNKLNNRFVVG